MANYAIMRFRKLKSPSACRSAINHIDRKIKNAFENEEIKNPNIYIGERPEKYMDFVRQSLAEGQKIRKDNVLALEFILTFTPNAIDKDNLIMWAKENFKWLAEEFGGAGQIFKFALHVHESVEHIHAIVLPCKDGKLNCKHYINNKSSLRRLQDSYAKKMSQFGLERGISKNVTGRYHKDVRTWQNEQIKSIEKKIQDLEDEKHSIREQREILDAVNALMDEEFDFRLAVNAKIGEQLVPQFDVPLNKDKIEENELLNEIYPR